MSAHSLQVAIVGAGPSGFYVAESLLGSGVDCCIDIYERLPSPYGLIRGGVAPDHQTTKSIQDVFARTAANPAVRFIGNVEIGRDLRLEDLRTAYDAVVLASGVPDDARLGIEGEELPGVYGAAEFVGWYNGHPDFRHLAPDLSGSTAVVLGNGNVALDVVRILAKTADELAASDLADHAAEALGASGIRDIHVIGRRGPIDAKFTNVELREIGTLDAAVALADPDQIPDEVPGDLSPRDRRMKSKNLDCFRAFSKADAGSAERRVRFGFHARPVAMLGAGRVEGVRFERQGPDGAQGLFDLPADLVVTSIGYRARGFEGLPVAPDGRALANEDGRIAEGLYVAGWLKRGPSGKIATNRIDGEAIAARLIEECAPSGRPGFAAVEAQLADIAAKPVSFMHWQHIDAAEIAAARAPAPRRKLTSVQDMLRAGGLDI